MSSFDLSKDSDPEIKKVLEEVESFTNWIFQHHKNFRIRSSKVIHDSVWGTHRYERFEIALINTPLVQRLRQIHQTSHAFLAYPSTRHTRFEHTLGVTAQFGKLFHSLLERVKHAHNDDPENLFGKETYHSLRAAAILHDVGHGPFSHTSEEIYAKYPEIVKLQQLEPFKKAAAGEILAYLILNTEMFKKIMEEIKVTYDVDFNCDLMKNAIVGFPSDLLSHYKVDMLNGPFDADKIDYLFRDGHFSGLPIEIDLDRFWYSLGVNIVEGRRRLTIDWGGVSTLEQILFSKMTLYPAVYHHHKVRACECMFKGIIEYIQEKKIPFDRDSVEIDFSRTIHFLYFTDFDFYDLTLCRKDPQLHELLHNLQYRRLLKRAVIISVDTIKPECVKKLRSYKKYRQTLVLKEGLEYYRWLAKQIWEEAGKPGLLQEIWVDCPDDPSFEEANDTWISPLGEGEDPMKLTKFFKIQQYAEQYKHSKWRSHVFCRHEDVDKVAEACVKIFKEELEIEFLSLAFQLCHVLPPKNLNGV